MIRNLLTRSMLCFGMSLKGQGTAKSKAIKSYIELKQVHIVGFSELNGWNQNMFHEFLKTLIRIRYF